MFHQWVLRLSLLPSDEGERFRMMFCWLSLFLFARFGKKHPGALCGLCGSRFDALSSCENGS
jgi:hypothetical protein